MATYPAAVYAPVVEVDGAAGTTMDAADVNTPNNEIVAVQTELGTVPKGTFADVKARLNVLGGIVLGPFAQRNVPASQAAVDIGFLADADFKQAVAFRAASIIGIAIRSTEARTAGTLTAEVFKGGVATGLTAVLDATNTQTKVTTQAVALDTVVAGDLLTVRITTDAAWLPVTADVAAFVELGVS